MWDLIVSVPDHCFSLYFLYKGSEKQKRKKSRFRNQRSPFDRSSAQPS